MADKETSNMVTLIAAILGFLGGLLSFIAGARLNRTGLRQRIRIWRIGKKLDIAYSKTKKNEIKKLVHLLQVMKLYSPVIVHQATAISYFDVLKNEDSFEILARRLGSPPLLSQEIKDMLISTLKKKAIGL